MICPFFDRACLISYGPGRCASPADCGEFWKILQLEARRGDLWRLAQA